VANKVENVDKYVASFPEDVQLVLRKIRHIITNAAPNSEESISYQIPRVTVDGHALIFFAGWKKHIGLYPIPQLDEPLEQEIAPYRATKDTVRLPLKDPIPYDLIERTVRALVEMRSTGVSKTKRRIEGPGAG
jgi:uncharacterized protein YdhG (YjbR/CyaY superfamily)